MSSIMKGEELHPLVEPLPVPGGWAHSYLQGYKQWTELLKGSRYSIGFKCHWSDLTSWFNANGLEGRERYIFGIAHEYFNKDFRSLVVGEQITEHQKARCEQIAAGVAKHIEEGGHKRYSNADPIRLWVSVMKEHKEGLAMTQVFMRECDTSGKKPYLFEKRLMPSDYDPDRPYELSTIKVFDKLENIPNKNGVEPLTKDQLDEKKRKSVSNTEPARTAHQPELSQPTRVPISESRRQSLTLTGHEGDIGMTKFPQSETVRPVKPPVFFPSASTSPPVPLPPCKRFRLESTPSPPAKVTKFSI